VSLDALACRPEVAERIAGRGGDYLLTLKGNRKRAHAEVRDWFAANAFALGGPLRPCFDAFDDGHGRLVRRRVFACPDVGVFASLEDWPSLRACLKISSRWRSELFPGRIIIPWRCSALPRRRQVSLSGHRSAGVPLPHSRSPSENQEDQWVSFRTGS
jgi:hypothetical protein